MIENLLLDSRKFSTAGHTIFIALTGLNHDGHLYIHDLINKGVEVFLVNKNADLVKFENICYIKVSDTLKALHQLAAHHRAQYTNLTVMGITGSNGKTIVKEWLYYLLKDHYKIVRSPRSYNSQIGVPLSVWQIQPHHNLAIFEAGISQTDEMHALEKIIQPNIGVLTNIGTAHDAGFENSKQKLEEKSKLFTNADYIVYDKSNRVFNQHFKNNFDTNLIGWGTLDNADLKIEQSLVKENGTELKVVWQGEQHDFWIPFTDQASIDNAIVCLICGLNSNLALPHLKAKLAALPVIAMHMEMKAGLNQCNLINDSYSNDLESLNIALDFLSRQSIYPFKTVILSNFEESGLETDALQLHLIKLLENKGINRLIGIGSLYQNWPRSKRDTIDYIFYKDTNELLKDLKHINFEKENILIKGSRKFGFETIVAALSEKTHQTYLEVNLNALQSNFNLYKSLLKSTTKTMVMVKAFAYGSGLIEVAKLLEFNKINYLAVAYADEGIKLREAGIQTPIMVMNTSPNQWASLLNYKLEPEIYSIQHLKAWLKFTGNLVKFEVPIHLKIDTGMHRLGILPDEIDSLCQLIQNHKSLQIASVFSHLAVSQNEDEIDFTHYQIKLFEHIVEKIQQVYDKPFLQHILNSAGIINYTGAQFDMVRLGIGLYGVDTSKKLTLQNVLTLKSYISQIKEVKEGSTIGYDRSRVAFTNMKLAVIGIGYADGLDRRYSNGVGSVLIDNELAPIVGKVCMDMAIIDVTNITSVYVGKEVLIFGNEFNITHVAEQIKTIPYEIMSSISSRVKRVFIQE